MIQLNKQQVNHPIGGYFVYLVKLLLIQFRKKAYL